MTDANLNSYIQPATEYVVAKINKADNTWQWDDTNQSDLKIATATVTSGQKDYTLSTAHLSIDRVEIKDSSGNWTRLKQIDQQDLKGGRSQALAAYQSTSGLPQEYDVAGSSIFLYPTPNYTQAASLKIYFTRGPLHFDYTTDTFTDSSGSVSSSPGFASLFHDLIPLKAAYDYCLMNIPELTGGYLAEILRIEKDLECFYGERNRDSRPRLSVIADNK